MFKKILIANRGEIAMRIIRTCRTIGIKTVVVYSLADKDSLPVRFADEAVCIGPNTSKDSYLNIPHIIAAAELTNADAIHPGYGFLSENHAFASACSEYKIKFIGPSPNAIQKMGDKSTAKLTMKAAGIPIIPGSDGILKSAEEGVLLAKTIGFPIILKATAGGGGKGMKVVKCDNEFIESWDLAKLEAQAAFGNSDLYLEKYIENPRHIEIQILADQFGNVCHFFERDCSIQRRHQKLIEETPSPFIDASIRKKMGQAAIEGAKNIAYEGLGTMEFLVDKDKNFYFMEMNTRVQVEHPVTEEITRLDLVKEQIQVAAGKSISDIKYALNGCSIECRINAENPKNNFMPSPGKIQYIHLPGGFGVRVDTHVYSGYVVTPYYDAMIAKLIVWAPNREEAINKMKNALEEFVIEGISTTIPFHRHLMSDEKFRSGNFSTDFVENFQF